MLRFLSIALLVSLPASCAGVPGSVLPIELLRNAGVNERAFEEIWPGDVLEVRHRNTPELDATVTVRPDGGISLPLAGQVRAAGRTPAELEIEIELACAREVIRPDVTVIVTEFTGRTVHVGGEVRAPGTIPLVRSTSLLETLLAAGGPLETARLQSVLVIRQFKGGKWRAFDVDVNAVIAGEADAFNLQLQPADVVFVPRSAIANVNLFVDQYIRKNLPVFVSIRPDIGANP